MSDESPEHGPQQPLGEAGPEEERETRSPQEAAAPPDRPGQFNSPLAVDPLRPAAEGTTSVTDGQATLGRQDIRPARPPLWKLRRGVVALAKVANELVDGNGRTFMLAPSEKAEVEEILGRLAQSVKDVRSALEHYTTEDGMHAGSKRPADKEEGSDDGQT